MKKAFLILGVVAVSAAAGGFTAWKVAAPREGSVQYIEREVERTPALGTHFTSYQAEQYPDLTYAAENAVKAVVNIEAVQQVEMPRRRGYDPFLEFFGIPQGYDEGPQFREQRAGGSGVIISKDGYIVTNNHVVEGADEITVKLNDDRELKGRIIGTDPSTDLALIKIEGDDFPTIPVGDSDQLKVGEWVLAVGNPFNLNSTVTAGIVSAKARSIGSSASNGQAANIQSFIQTDAAINQGNSGGALVNAKGELVGINAMLYSPTGAYSGYGFAIPTSIMTKVVADLKQFGTVQRALLGIKGSDLSTDLQMDERWTEELKKKADELGVKEGIYVAEVVEGGSAAGILKENDVIIALNGKKIHKFSDLQEMLAKHRPGDKVKVTVVRDKKEKEFEITLKNEQGTTKVVKDAGMEILGAAFKPVSSELKKQLNLGYGLEVTGVTNGKMADAGIRKGFIILKANGVPMKLTNVYVGEGATKTIELRRCFKEGESTSFTATCADSEIATVKVSGSKVIVTGLKQGRTKLSVTSGKGETQTSTITVRKGAAHNGWL